MNSIAFREFYSVFIYLRFMRRGLNIKVISAWKIHLKYHFLDSRSFPVYAVLKSWKITPAMIYSVVCV